MKKERKKKEFEEKQKKEEEQKKQTESEKKNSQEAPTPLTDINKDCDDLMEDD